MKSSSLAFTFLFGASLAAAARACDSCAISLASGDGHAGLFSSVTEQFTHMGTLQLDGTEVPNDLDQFLDSSITHFNLGSTDGNRLSWQATLPYVHRSFRRPEGEAIVRGTESGFGDAMVVGHVVVARGLTAETAWNVGAMAGIKLPTGSTNRLAEELTEDESPGGEPSAIHGHDLTLGSGSTDALLGLDGHWTAGRFFLEGSLQYSLRQPGDYDYRFANELLWRTVAGWYPTLTHEHSFAAALVLSGESKGRDSMAGEIAEDTGLNATYLGTRLAWSVSDRWNADVEIEWPVRQHNTALQAVADFRCRAGVTLRF